MAHTSSFFGYVSGRKLVWVLKGDTQQNDIKINLVSLAVENDIPKPSEILLENFFYNHLIFN